MNGEEKVKSASSSPWEGLSGMLAAGCCPLSGVFCRRGQVKFFNARWHGLLFDMAGTCFAGAEDLTAVRLL